MSKHVELARHVAFAEVLADEARAVVCGFGDSVPVTLYKSDTTPVTEVDRAVERVLREHIDAAYPEHGVLGEEFGNERLDAEFVWVLDPIDGTASYIAGLPIFGVLIALCRDGAPVVGVIDSPLLGQRWVGAPGGTTFNGRRVMTRGCAKMAEAVQTTSSPEYFGEDSRDAYQRMIAASPLTVFGAGCYGYGRLAGGFIDVGFEASHEPFDYLALVPVVANAGGFITDWGGKPLTVDSGDKIVAAGDARVHAEALELLRL